MKRIRVEQMELYLVQFLLVCVACIYAAQMFGLSKFTSVLFTLTFPLTGLGWLLSLRKGVNKKDVLMIIAAVLACVSVLVDLLLNGGAFSFSYVKKLVMFIMSLLFLQTADKLETDRRLVEFLQVPVDVLTGLMVVMFLLARDRMYMINGIVSRYLTFGFSNPNMTCMFLVCMFMLTFCYLVKVSGKKSRIAHGVILALQGVFILLTQCRNGLMIVVLFLAVAACVLLKDKIEAKLHRSFTLRFPHWLSGLIGCFPMIFAVLYMNLIHAEWVQSLFGFLVSEGKGLDSRVKQWTPAFDAIRQSPLTGSYFTISDGTGNAQMHSTHVDAAASYGIPVMVLLCVLLALYIYQKRKVYSDRLQFLYMVGFCCTMLMGTFEAAVFSGGLGIYVFAVIFLAFSKSVPEGTAPDEGWGWDRLHKEGRLLQRKWQARKKR